MGNKATAYNLSASLGILRQLDHHWFKCDLFAKNSLNDTQLDSDFKTIKSNLVKYVQEKLLEEGKPGLHVSMKITLTASDKQQSLYQLNADPIIIPKSLLDEKKPTVLTPVILAGTNSTHNPPPPPPPPPPTDNVLKGCKFLFSHDFTKMVRTDVTNQLILNDAEYKSLKANFAKGI